VSVYRFLSQKILRMETRVNSSAFFSFTENRRSRKSLPRYLPISDQQTYALIIPI
jgi:hypothetical protein